MVKESLALQRVGEWAGLTDEDLYHYLNIAGSVQIEKLDQRDDFRGFRGERYFEFLNEEVLSDERVIHHLESSNPHANKLQMIKDGEVPIMELYSVQFKSNYGLDQVVDFVMMIKFVRNYIKYTGEDGIEPRNRLQFLLYLVNYQLSQRDTFPNRLNRTNLGNLEYTGYRYTFSKGQRGPFSQKLYQDKNRLFAQKYLHEEVMEATISQEDEPYRISLGNAGETLFARYGNKLSDMNGVLLKEWDLRQMDVLYEYAELSHKELKETIQSMEKFEATPLTNELLQARHRDFDKPMEPIRELISSV